MSAFWSAGGSAVARFPCSIASSVRPISARVRPRRAWSWASSGVAAGPLRRRAPGVGIDPGPPRSPHAAKIWPVRAPSFPRRPRNPRSASRPRAPAGRSRAPRTAHSTSPCHGDRPRVRCGGASRSRPRARPRGRPARAGFGPGSDGEEISRLSSRTRPKIDPPTHTPQVEQTIADIGAMVADRGSSRCASRRWARPCSIRPEPDLDAAQRHQQSRVLGSSPRGRR